MLFRSLYGRVTPGLYFASQALIVAIAALAFRRVAAPFEGPVTRPAATPA